VSMEALFSMFLILLLPVVCNEPDSALGTCNLGIMVGNTNHEIRVDDWFLVLFCTVVVVATAILYNYIRETH
jgi:hypothetical protein